MPPLYLLTNCAIMGIVKCVLHGKSLFIGSSEAFHHLVWIISALGSMIMKKRQIANLAMAAIILVIVIAGVLTVGHIQGWFDKNDGEAAVLTQIRGIVNLQRAGAAYPVRQDTVLRVGDIVTCESGATAKIAAADGYLVLGEKAGAEVTDASAQSFAATVSGGEVFVNTASTMTLSFDGKNAVFTGAVASLSVRSGAQSISVFAGTVENAQAGQVLDWVGDTVSVTELSIKSLNDFHIEQMRTVGESMTLCFSNAELNQLKADRLAQTQAQVQPTESAKPEETVSATHPEESEPDSSGASTENPGHTDPTEEAQPTAPQPTATEPPVNETEPSGTEPEAKLSCTLSIRCDTILNHWDNLDPAKTEYVPKDGCILYATVAFTEGETVFDVLKRACADYGIQIEYSWTPLYGSYYVEGIHHLYAFDCGYESGWMYKVNGWFPNYGCSSYTLSDGDHIVWCYTCSGLGADVGA